MSEGKFSPVVAQKVFRKKAGKHESRIIRRATT